MFTTVEEAQSATDTDVEMYLTKLKLDLIVGEPGYPKVITIACDQQIYALIVNMKKRYLNRFDWVLAVHGDWHCLSLTAEILQDLLWDGGLRQLTELCGYKHQLTQWQELHLMLTALYEALLRKAVKEYRVQISLDRMTDFGNGLPRQVLIQTKIKYPESGPPLYANYIRMWAISFQFVQETGCYETVVLKVLPLCFLLSPIINMKTLVQQPFSIATHSQYQYLKNSKKVSGQ